MDPVDRNISFQSWCHLLIKYAFIHFYFLKYKRDICFSHIIDLEELISKNTYLCGLYQRLCQTHKLKKKDKLFPDLH